MQVTGIPAAVAAGSVVCLTVTGAAGAITATSDGAIKVNSVTQSATRPGTWIVCVTVDRGFGGIYVQDGSVVRTSVVRGR